MTVEGRGTLSSAAVAGGILDNMDDYCFYFFHQSARNRAGPTKTASEDLKRQAHSP